MRTSIETSRATASERRDRLFVYRLPLRHPRQRHNRTDGQRAFFPGKNLFRGTIADGSRSAAARSKALTRFRIGCLIREEVGLFAFLAAVTLISVKSELMLSLLPRWVFIICGLILWSDHARRRSHKNFRKSGG